MALPAAAIIKPIRVPQLPRELPVTMAVGPFSNIGFHISVIAPFPLLLRCQSGLGSADADDITILWSFLTQSVTIYPAKLPSSIFRLVRATPTKFFTIPQATFNILLDNESCQ